MVSFAFAFTVNSQDFSFSTPYSNPLNLNPAFAGSIGIHRLTAGYNMGLAYYQLNEHTVNIAYDSHCDKLKGGLGVVFSSYSQNEGNLVKMRGALIYSPVFKVKEKIIVKPAVELGYGSNTTLTDTGLSQSTKVFKDKNYFDVNIGVLSYCDRMYGGFAVKHLTQPDIGFFEKEKLPMYITVHVGGFLFKPKDEQVYQVSPSITFNTQGDKYQQYIYGVDAKYKKVAINAYFIRNIYFNDGLALGAGYDSGDFCLSFIHSFYPGGVMMNAVNNEFTLTWRLKCKNKELSFKPLNLISF